MRSLGRILALSIPLILQGASAAGVRSPDGRLAATLDVTGTGGLRYGVSYRGKPLLADSGLGLEIRDMPDMTEGFRILELTPSTYDETWRPVYGERSEVRDRYNQLIVDLEGGQGRRLRITFRAYDEGVAYRYTVPKQGTGGRIHITSEKSEFRFLDDHKAWAVYSAQGRYAEVPLSRIKPGCERPLTIQAGPETFVALAEARLVDHARMKLAPVRGKPHALVSSLSGEVKADLPLTTPWRVIMVAETPGRLLEQNDIILNLNDPCAIEDPSWIKPGKVIREVTLTTVGGKACVDFAVEHHLQYVEFDAGWYGHEYSDDADATTVSVDPKRSPGPLDLPEVIRYARERGIGVILYVNRRALERQLDVILPLYRRWGIRGVKYGFVDVGSQAATRWLHDAVRKAAAHRLMVDVHDEVRPTGYSRTYPNLMTQEGIAGDETSPENHQTLIILFTRMLAGAGDNTICYYDGRVDRNSSHAYQLAKAVCIYSPWQFLYWYDRPPASPHDRGGAGGSRNRIGDEPELEFFDHVPTVWDDTRVIHGRIGEVAVIARRSGGDWFIGCMNSGRPRTLEIPLDFLENGKKYTAHIYRDDEKIPTRTRVRIERLPVDADTVLKATVAAKGGQAIRIVPAAHAAGGEGDTCEIENSMIQVRLSESAGDFSVRTRPAGRVFIPRATLGEAGGKARVARADHRTFGKGKAIEVSYPSGNIDKILVFPDLPFVLLQSILSNGGEEPLTLKQIRRFSLGVELGRPVGGPRTYGTGGLGDAARQAGSYAYLAVVDPPERSGVVSGWLTHDRGSGVVFSSLKNKGIHVEAQIDYGRLRIDPGRSEATEVFAVGWFDDARSGLEAYADAIARIYSVRLPPQPVGYCTWYSDRHGGASDEIHLAELAAFAARELKPFGFEFVQIDDFWQDGTKQNGPAKNFTSHRPDGPYPGGMKAIAGKIEGLGLVPGIWFMPFAGNHKDPFFEDHLEWFVRGKSGEPYEARWGGTSLDMTHPGAREHVRGVVNRIAHDWGYRFFKMDGLWTGTATRLLYVNDGYREDDIGEAVFHEPGKTNIEIYRDGLRLVRAAAGEDVFLLGCCVSQNMRSFGGTFGLVDAMRVGPDTGSGMIGARHGSRHYFLHGRVWYNDPDCVSVRANLSLDQARLNASWTAITGQLFYNSDWLPGLPGERLDILRRTIPGHGLRPRPVDLFENDPPRVWLLTDDRRSPRRDVIALFNWGEDPIEFDSPLEWIGLDGGTTYVGFEYWENRMVGPLEGQVRFSLPGLACRILAVRPVAAHPQLLSTSRHVTQGIVDVLEERWNDTEKVLAGRSRVIGGDPYEMRIVPGPPGDPCTVESLAVSGADRAAGAKIAAKDEGRLLRVVVDSPVTREVQWSVRFRRG